jgi:hypothetical protein
MPQLIPRPVRVTPTVPLAGTYRGLRYTASPRGYEIFDGEDRVCTDDGLADAGTNAQRARLQIENMQPVAV